MTRAGKFIIPKAMLVGFGRTQTVQHVCLTCGKNFFPDDQEDAQCPICVETRQPIHESAMVDDKLFLNIVGWEQRVQASWKRSNFNYRKVMIRDEYTCRYCGYSPTFCSEFIPLHIDHIFPHSTGGNNRLDNLVIACQWCNLRLSNKVFPSFIDKKIYISELRAKLGLPQTSNQWRECDRMEAE